MQQLFAVDQKAAIVLKPRFIQIDNPYC